MSRINEFPELSTISGDDLVLVWDAANGITKKIKASNLSSSSSSSSSSNVFILLSHTLPSGTNGGNATFGAWTDRPINTIDYDNTGVVSLSSNVFTLPTGTYIIDAKSTFYNLSDAKLRLYNKTTNTSILTGLNGWVNPGGTVALPLHLSGKFTISGPQNLSLQYWAKTISVSSQYNYGGSVSDGSPEKYASIDLWKVA